MKAVEIIRKEIDIDGKKIRMARAIKNLNRKELTEISGVSRAVIAGLENNKKKYPRIDTVERIAKALDVDISYFEPDKK